MHCSLYCGFVDYTTNHIHDISCALIYLYSAPCVVGLWTTQLIIFITFPVYLYIYTMLPVLWVCGPHN